MYEQTHVINNFNQKQQILTNKQIFTQQYPQYFTTSLQQIPISQQWNNQKRMSVESSSRQQSKWFETLINELQDNIVKCVVEVEGLVTQKIQQDLAASVVETLNKIVQHLANAKTLLQTRSPPQPIHNPLVTPKKHSTHSKRTTFGFTSQIKTTQDFQTLASANDQLYKECEEILEKYHYNKQMLNHENQIVLNQWIQNTNHISSNNQSGKKPNKSTFFNLVKTLIQELSKYESVEEYINTVEQIEHDKIVNELRSTCLQTSDVQKKWLKQTTKDYFLKMAELLKNQENTTTDDDQIDDFQEEELENIF